MKVIFLQNKKGQFYLATAVIIIGIVLGFVTISNSSKTTNTNQLKNLAEELRIESGNVLDYDLNNSANKIKKFTKNFSDYAGEDVNIIYILNQSGNLSVYNYTEGNENMIYSNLTNNQVNVSLDENTYTFELNKGINFYFIMSEKIGDEIYVATS